jgi:hypothetical protein
MLLVAASYGPLSYFKLNSTSFGQFYLKASITSCCQHRRLRAYNRFVDLELLSLAHKFYVAVFLSAHEQGQAVQSSTFRKHASDQRGG